MKAKLKKKKNRDGDGYYLDKNNFQQGIGLFKWGIFLRNRIDLYTCKNGRSNGIEIITYL